MQNYAPEPLPDADARLAVTLGEVLGDVTLTSDEGEGLVSLAAAINVAEGDGGIASADSTSAAAVPVVVSRVEHQAYHTWTMRGHLTLNA
jgi:hypothetical protein